MLKHLPYWCMALGPTLSTKEGIWGRDKGREGVKREWEGERTVREQSTPVIPALPRLRKEGYPRLHGLHSKFQTSLCYELPD